MSALETLEQNLIKGLSSHENPEVKSFAWMGILMALLPILLEQFQNCDVAQDELAQRLSKGTFQDRLAAAHMLRKALQESGSTMGFVQRAAFMTMALSEFKNVDNNKLIIGESKSLAWSFI